MPRDMLQFTRLSSHAPEKRSAESRRHDFAEIYQPWPDDKAADQASRCEQCGIPFCQVHCPVQNNIPDWLKLTAEGMHVDGQAKLGGIPSTVSWDEDFSGAQVRSRYVLNPVLDNNTRPLVGLDARFFTPPYLDGPAKAHVVYTVMRDRTATMEAQADFAPATMAIPELGWRKAAGEPATGSVSAKLAGDHFTSIPKFHVVSDGLDIEIGRAHV